MSQRKPSLRADSALPTTAPLQPVQVDADAEMRQLQWAGLSPERQLTLWGLTLLALGLALYFLSPVLAPFVAGTALGYLLDPVADRLQRLGLSRLGAAGLLLVVFLFVVGTAAVVLVPILSHQLAGFITSLPGYLQTLHGLLTQWSERVTSDSINGWLQEFGLGGAAATFDAQKYISDLTSQAATLFGDFVKSLLWRGYALINVISLIVITPVVAFYMLVDWDHMVAVIDDLIPPRHRDDVRSLARDIDRALAGFVRGQSLVCLFLGVWYAVGLSAIGLNFGFLIGVSAGFLSFIPYVGSITAFVLSIIVAVVQGWPHVHLPIEAVAIVTTGLIMDGYVLSPRLVGASVGLHPVWIMFALLAFGALFGFTGLILAVPVAAALGAFIRFLARRYRASALYQHPISDRA
ncbi:MAG: AI-2E family transporter [Alphaproteobacteria bacterium]|nr:AI-2E family transporter [Alphaproteobacteria bacterium]MBM3640088.1 AI-2E family transporter [Alphaproteobacteria bacterium]